MRCSQMLHPRKYTSSRARDAVSSITRSPRFLSPACVCLRAPAAFGANLSTRDQSILVQMHSYAHADPQVGDREAEIRGKIGCLDWGKIKQSPATVSAARVLAAKAAAAVAAKSARMRLLEQRRRTSLLRQTHAQCASGQRLQHSSDRDSHCCLSGSRCLLSHSGQRIRGKMYQQREPPAHSAPHVHQRLHQRHEGREKGSESSSLVLSS